MNSTLTRISQYKELKADIGNIRILVQELEDEILGTSGQGTEERTGKTNKFSSVVEQQAEKLMERKEQLYKDNRIKEREIQRIDNAMTILTDDEREIINLIYIENKRYCTAEEKTKLTYARIKQIEKEATNKMKKYIS